MISVQDFKTNPHWIFAAHELAAIVDPDMATKMTVQFNLFGGTVLKLGTEVLFRTREYNLFSAPTRHFMIHASNQSLDSKLLHLFSKKEEQKIVSNSRRKIFEKLK